MNKHEENRQFITCSGDMYVLIWDLLKPEQDTDAPAQAAPAMAEEVTHSINMYNYRLIIHINNSINFLGRCGSQIQA